MEKIKVIGLHSFGSNGVSFYPGMEAEVDKKDAEQWVKAGLVKKSNEDIEEAQIVEEPKELTPEEVERQNLEAILNQLGRTEGLDTLSNDELENNIHDILTKKIKAREVAMNESAENTENKDENTNESTGNVDVPKKGKKTQSIAE